MDDPGGKDALEGTQWVCASTAPGAITDPRDLESVEEWFPARVPGTAALAMRDAERWTWGRDDEALLDGRDWWFRARWEAGDVDGPWRLEIGGLATLADVWLNGEHVSSSDNMFRSMVVDVESLQPLNDLVIRCAALTPRLLGRHPRPRFKSRLIRHQSLRWYRTSLLGRMPGWSRWAAPVGPWRPVRLVRGGRDGTLADIDLQVRCDTSGPGATVSVSAGLPSAARRPQEAWLHVGEERAALEVSESEAGLRLGGSLHLDHAERWWPHTHGAQPRYPARVELDGAIAFTRQIGFRTVQLDREAGAFTPAVNGTRCFWRGVVWATQDAVALTSDDAQLRRTLELVRAANVNLIRIGGFGVYEDARFWDLCDELGIMVWQDCMLASFDPPDEPTFIASLSAELVEQFGALQGRPSLLMTCGSSETYQQGSMYGLAPERYESDVLEHTLPRVLEAVVPDVPYIPSSPWGGNPPIRPDTGVAHYFGVGAYLRPLSDADAAGVRFAAECLSFATPPERVTVERAYGSAQVAAHDPRWKLAVARDAGTSWDFEDVGAHYVAEVFGIDPLAERYGDPEHALDRRRAAIAEIMVRVLGGWRPAGSGCAGAVVLAWSDLWPGAGWGVVDAFGIPKASYFAIARAFAPRAVHLHDLGLSGLAVGVFNDPPEALEATLSLTVFGQSATVLERAEIPVSVRGGGEASFDASEMLDGFRDLTDAYRFAPPQYDVVHVALTDATGAVIASAHHLPSGLARQREPEVGLRAVARPGIDGDWVLAVSTKRFAHFVSVDVPGLLPSDSWFHLAPGETVELTLHGSARTPEGVVRALNSIQSARVEVVS